MHKLLARQLRRHFGAVDAVPPELQGFLALVDAAYHQADHDRAQLERSLETVSEELVERYRDLRNEQARYRILAEERSLGPMFQRAGVALMVTDLDGRLLHTNPAFERFVGYGAKELIGRPETELSPAEDAAPTQAALLDLMGGTVDSAQVEKRFVHRDGRTLVGRLTLTLVKSDAGEPLYVLGLVEDVMERNRMEEALKQSEAQLRQAQKMDAIGRLAGGVAHDFNNLLTAILGPVDLARAQLPDDHPALAELEDIKAAAEQGSGLTQQLLAFGRQRVLTAEVLDLGEAVEETARMLRRVLGGGVDLTLDLARSAGMVRADRTHLHQVIMNLAVNARDAMPDGGILTIRTREVSLDDAYVRLHPTAKPGRHLQLVVADTGSGMDPRTLEHLFEPFFTTKEQHKGTGLGLTTVHGIVTQAGGHVSVESELGKGTTFTAYFPWVDPAEAESARRAPRDGPVRGGSETVLVVDDDPVVLRVARRTLARAGYRVISAPDGLGALGAFQQHRQEIALVVTDVVMPGMTGAELAQRLAEVAPELPVLFTSGYADEASTRLRGVKPGSPFLQKPFTVDGLTAKVREVLDRHPVP